MEVKFGVNLWGEESLKRAPLVEALGFDSAWAGEHIFFYGPTSDAIASMAFMAATTSRITVGSSAVILPLRPPAVVAKALATIDILSGGRTVLGIGVGGEYPREFVACGVPVEERGPRTNEAIGVLRRLWTEAEVTHQGRFYQMEGVTLQPPPVQRPIPIWVAGRSEAALRRAGRLGDGYMPYLFTPDRYREAVAEVRGHAEAAGRDPDALAWSIYQFICVADSHERAREMASQDLTQRYSQPFDRIVDRYCVLGTPEECRRRLEEYIDAGVRHFIFAPISPLEELEQHLTVYAKEIIPPLRRAAAG